VIDRSAVQVRLWQADDAPSGGVLVGVERYSALDGRSSWLDGDVAAVEFGFPVD
jgi:hypothetical protein